MTVAALLLAGGRGTRAGGGLPKQYRDIAGQSVLRRAVRCFVDCPAVDLVKVVIHPDDAPLYREATDGFDVLDPVHGGAERHLSALNGLESLAPLAPTTVLIHDAARPIVDSALIERVIAAVQSDGADGAIPALPVSDTLKRVDNGGRIEDTVDRTALWRAQTPQGFRFEAILEAHRARAQALPTDDAAVMEAHGGAVSVVLGDERNIKVTTEPDFGRAARLVEGNEMTVHTGMGFDVHRFGPGDAVMLCGVSVPHDHGLVGHSDADVALHALTDALLGAVGAGDIGQHFPPSDPQWKGVESHIFVAEAARHIASAGGRINHVDITIIGERPKVGPHRDAMRRKVADMLSVSETSVNVKATTTERLGFTGRGEGLAAQAVATVELPGREHG